MTVAQPFCDYLDVTYAPDDCPSPELNTLLLGCGFLVSRDRSGKRLYVAPNKRGTVMVMHSKRFAKISISGASCGFLRSSGYWLEALSILSTSPHKVTRLDAAVDLPIDAAPFIAKLCKRYPDGWANLSRKAQRITRVVSTRADGLESGTWYVGHSDSGRQSLRVYDKTLQMLDRYGEVIPLTTRVEVTASKDKGATLHDAESPTALFWSIAAPTVLKAPEGIPVWTPNTDTHWLASPRSFVPAEILKRRIENSAELDAFLELADAVGPYGRDYMLNLLRSRVQSQDSDTTPAQSEAAA
jgi:hypothetical protein